VKNDVTGGKVCPNNPDSLAWVIARVLIDENCANTIKHIAYKKGQRKKTVYEAVLKEYSESV
jgi:hypothetical protein